MAAKFAKEEEIYSDSNYDNTSVDTEYNNSQSRSTSPSEALEDRVYNDISRSGGPCASQQAKCDGCTVFTYIKPCQVFQCRKVHYFCDSCANGPHCPVHRMCKRK